MNKELYSKLKSIDTTVIAKELLHTAMKLEIKGDKHNITIIAAYVTYLVQSCEKSDIGYRELIDLAINNEEVRQLIYRYENSVYHIVDNIKGVFTNDMLLSFVLFNNTFEKDEDEAVSTPDDVLSLAIKLLDISDSDTVIDFCSGKGNFATAAYAYNDANYLGIELNYRHNDIAIIRSYILGNNCEYTINDAISYTAQKKADKVFANYPFFSVKDNLSPEKREMVAGRYNIPSGVIRKSSMEWIFNLSAIDNMKADGKAVAIMPKGKMYNHLDKEMRKHFVENGLIEAIIYLPERIFEQTSLQTALVVFSHGNEKIRFINATQMFESEWRKNTITEEYADQIVKLLCEDGSNVIDKTVEEISLNNYELDVEAYLSENPTVEDGVPFESVIKNIYRGNQMKAEDMTKYKSETISDYMYLKISNIDDGSITIEDDQYLASIPSGFEKFILKNNSIVITRTGIPSFKSAVAQIENNKKVIATGNVIVVEVDETLVNPFFVQSFLNSHLGESMLISISKGTAIRSISLEALKKMEIPLPDMDKQNSIANKYAAVVDDIAIMKKRIGRMQDRLSLIFEEE